MPFKEPDVHVLFPVPLLSFQLANADALNARLVTEVLARREKEKGVQRSNRYGWHSENDLFKRKLVRIAGPTITKKKITVQILDEINVQIEHTEIMLQHFGADVERDGRVTRLGPKRHLTGQLVAVPGDPSSAAFALAAAAILPDSEVSVAPAASSA